MSVAPWWWVAPVATGTAAAAAAAIQIWVNAPKRRRALDEMTMYQSLLAMGAREQAYVVLELQNLILQDTRQYVYDRVTEAHRFVARLALLGVLAVGMTLDVVVSLLRHSTKISDFLWITVGGALFWNLAAYSASSLINRRAKKRWGHLLEPYVPPAEGEENVVPAE